MSEDTVQSELLSLLDNHITFFREGFWDEVDSVLEDVEDGTLIKEAIEDEINGLVLDLDVGAGAVIEDNVPETPLYDDDFGF